MWGWKSGGGRGKSREFVGYHAEEAGHGHVVARII